MKSLFKLWILTLAILTACGGKLDENQKRQKELTELREEYAEIGAKISKLEGELTTTEVAKGVLVEVDSIKAEKFDYFIEVHGTVEADLNTQVMPEVNGLIQEIRVEKGQKVFKGDVLAVLSTDLIRQNIKEIENNLELAKNIFAKQENLWKQNIGTEIQFLEAKNRKNSLENNLSSLRTQLAKSYIKAPVTGAVDEIYPKVGEMVSPQLPLARVVNVEKVYVTADVSESYIGKFKKGDNAIIHFPSVDKEMNSKISAVGQFINPNNRTFKVTIKLDNKNGAIKPNMLSVLKIKVNSIDSAIVVPISVVQTDSKGSYLFTIKNENNQKLAFKTYVETGTTYNGFTVVTAGLKPNDVVITQGFRGIVDGEAVIF